MAYTLLQAVNLNLKRAGLIAGATTVLTSLTDTARQRDIDTSIQIWNEAIRAIFSYRNFPGETAQASVTLTDGGREYSLASDFEQFAGDSDADRVFTCASNRLKVWPYPGGYQQMFVDQPNPADFTGLPMLYAINTNNGTVRFDRTQTSSEAGLVYTYNYVKRSNVQSATDTFPFSDSVVDELVPVVAQLYSLDINKTARDPISSSNGFKIALQLAAKSGQRSQYGRYRQQNVMGWRGPFEP